MTTNAQAALVAAATLNADRHGVTANAVTALADRFKTWLDEHDAVSESAERDEPGKVMRPRHCLEEEGTGCLYDEPHRHGFACTDCCQCKAGGPLVRDYLLDGDRRIKPDRLPSSEGHPDRLVAGEPYRDADGVLGCDVRRVRDGADRRAEEDDRILAEPEQGERETQLDALVIPAETTGPDELHADKRPDSYGDRGESRTGRKRRKGGARGRAEGLADLAVEAAGAREGNIVVTMSKTAPVVGFAPNGGPGAVSPAMLAHAARQINATRGRV